MAGKFVLLIDARRFSTREVDPGVPAALVAIQNRYHGGTLLRNIERRLLAANGSNSAGGSGSQST
jgi:hypothetical protein